MVKKIVLGVLLVFTYASVGFADFPINTSWDSLDIGANGEWKSQVDGWDCVSYSAGGVDKRNHGTIDSSSGTPDSSNALRIMFPVGWPGGYVTYMCGNKLGSRQNNWWGQYYIKYSNNWDWNGVVEKQFYFWQGTMSTGDVIGLSGVQRIQFRNQYVNNNIYRSNTGYDPVFERGVWYKVKFHIRMNTPGSSNGWGEIWVNNRLVMSHKDIKWLKDTDSPGNGTGYIELNPIWGGITSPKDSGAGNGDQYVWYDKTIFQDTDPGGGGGDTGGGGGDIGKTPMPADTIRID